VKAAYSTTTQCWANLLKPPDLRIAMPGGISAQGLAMSAERSDADRRFDAVMVAGSKDETH
jgi:hypothetical protein